MYNILVMLILTFYLPVASNAVEISLDKQPSTISQGKGQETSIGYVDIDKVFSEHPMTKRLKDEFCVTADSKKKEINTLQLEIGRLEQMIISSTTILNRTKDEIAVLKNVSSKIDQNALQPAQTSQMNLQVSQSTPTSKPAVNPAVISEKEKAVSDIEKGLEIIKKTAETKKLDIVKLVNTQKECLTKLEEDQTNNVLADIYTVLGKIADEEGVTIIVDKSQILFGKTAKDLTDKVLDRLRGR
ncbi:MAG: hypothetical protein LHV68_02530 [Elusimicrobia bacterium]|nr:hypothetical protein [Candidatus Liberimonas magnetica]